MMVFGKGVITPIHVEFILLTRENISAAAEWCDGNIGNGYIDFEDYNKRIMRISYGNYLVKRPSGFMAMSPEEFNLSITPDA